MANALKGPQGTTMKAGVVVARDRRIGSEVFAMAVAVLAAVLVLGAMVGTRWAEAAFPGENGKIVFSSNRDRGAQDILTISPTGGTTDTLTTFSIGHNIDPAVSPDGSRIAFSRDNQIWVMPASGMNSDGTGATQITTTATSKTKPTWSPDGSQIAYVANSFDVDRQTDPEIWTINADGSGRTQLTNNTVSDNQPAWSPDGTQIAFVTGRTGDTNSNIYIMDTNPSTDDAVNLTANSTTPIYQGHDDFPSWSPDGTQITYTNNGEGGDADVFTMDTNPVTTDWTNLTPNQGEDTNPAWSPDGTQIAYQGTTTTATDRNIYVMDANGANQRPIDTDVAHDISPDWQPDAPTCDITGTPGDDTRTGTTADETICGLGGNDVINGGGGSDILMGGAGNDTLVDPSGRATLNGGDGSDIASFAGSATPIEASLSTGFAHRVGTNPLEIAALVGIENLTGSSLGDGLTGSNTANKLVGGDGADELLGLGSKDTINARDGAKNDTVNGGSGTDRCSTDRKEVSIKSC